MRFPIYFLIFIIFNINCFAQQNNDQKPTINEKTVSTSEESNKTYPLVKTDKEWKEILNNNEFYVLREKGTERSYSGGLLKNKKHGIYVCRGCNQNLFLSDTKFKSGTGWPSFYQPIKSKIIEIEDNTNGMTRIEIVCSNCGGHLGHVFNDGPPPTGLRYCINSISLQFEEK